MDRRKLRIWNLNLALSYVSELLEKKRKTKELEQDIKLIKSEVYQWEAELNRTVIKNGRESKANTVSEIKEMQEIIYWLERNIQEIRSKYMELDSYAEELRLLVGNLMNFVLIDSQNGKSLHLTYSEIDQNMLAEYVYILSEFTLDEDENDYIELEDFFEEVRDFSGLIMDYYGKEQYHLYEELINDDYLCGFESYFSY